MIKKVIRVVLHSAIIGFFVGFTVAMVCSLLNETKYFMPASPDWVNRFSTPLQATLVAGLLWMGMGIVFGVGALIFNYMDGSITKKTIIHFAWTFIGFAILAFNAGWDITGWDGTLIFVVIFIIVYVIIWSISMLRARQNVDQVNATLHLN
ncbi:DUF3021 domain-containing protein [Eupransor demetentiae]|uniref:DUF3021 domain-containing protein n=1 Tax=Eupransor demetentiae TaxID=3109584 RepID=A0ABP0ESX0_9LACO|nr:hypothetical protein R54876_GBNLAHCA_01036 [Lactobacillaceae bacterium LMG 33000]